MIGLATNLLVRYLAQDQSAKAVELIERRLTEQDPRLLYRHDGAAGGPVSGDPPHSYPSSRLPNRPPTAPVTPPTAEEAVAVSPPR
jgi:hypothetical protein